MADVEMTIGGHVYALSCADGEEPALRRLGALVDDRIASARQMVGNLSETRQLLFAAILLADEVQGTQLAPPPTRQDGATVAELESMADRMEQLARRLGAIADSAG